MKRSGGIRDVRVIEKLQVLRFTRAAEFAEAGRRGDAAPTHSVRDQAAHLRPGH